MQTLTHFLQTIFKTRRHYLLRSLFLCGICLSVLFSACDLIPQKEVEEIEPTPTLAPAPPSKKFGLNNLNLGVTTLKGEIEFDRILNPEQVYPPAVVMLQDASAIIAHDRSMPAPAEAQTLGYITLKGEQSEFSLMLPIQPKGVFHDLDYDGKDEQGVQVFYLSMEIQRGGGPYFENYDDWADHFSSLNFEDGTAFRVSGGYLVVWAADDQQSFPMNFGDDGILFSEDDPSRRLGAGYTVVDMSGTPFYFERSKETYVSMDQVGTSMNKELWKLSYSEAFDSLYADMKENYAFVGVEGKHPDWEEIYNTSLPAIQSAEEDGNAKLYYKALKAFADQFSDSHVSVYQDEYDQQAANKIHAGYGFMVDEVQQGEFIVSYLDEYNSLEEYGIRLGDALIAIEGKPVAEILQAADAPYGPYSREELKRIDQIQFLTRGKEGRYQSFDFQLSDGMIISVYIPAYWDYPTLYYGSTYRADVHWPVEYDVLKSGYGYVVITSNSGGEAFTRHMFENALDDLQAQDVPGIIIDLRYNHGGQLLNLYEYFLTDAVKISNFIYPGIKDKDGAVLDYEFWAHPYLRQYHFEDMAVLVGSGCISACEVEAYGFSLLPDVKMIGSEATAGAVALIQNSAFQMPENIEFNFPIAKLVNEDGSLFLEGQGVAPQIVFPKALGTITAYYDWLMIYADHYLQYRDELEMKAAYNPQPVNVDLDRYMEMMKGDEQINLDHASVEYYPLQLFMPGESYPYHTFLEAQEDVFIETRACTYDMYNFSSYFSGISVRYLVNGDEIPKDYLVTEFIPEDDQWCMVELLSLTDWSVGVNEVTTEMTYATPLFDGQRWVPAGTITRVYNVVVKDSEE